MKKTLNPNDFGRKNLVENCQKIKIDDFLPQCKEKMKKELIKMALKLLGYQVNLTTSRTLFNGVRLWFKCPLCGERVGIIYKHPLSNKIGCRICLRLSYRKRRFKGMIEEQLPKIN